MKSRPILFSAPMVRALLDGRKTQTRRAVKPSGWQFEPTSGSLAYNWLDDMTPIWLFKPQDRSRFKWVPCPYGRTGDELWVRETFGEFVRRPGVPVYRADDPLALGSSNSWRPSIHMPRKYSRITLRITDVRVEPLQAISETDAIAEGIEPVGEAWRSYEIIHEGPHKGKPNPHSAVPNRAARTSYRELWEAINGPDSWTANPWVWVVSFEVKS